MKLEDMQAVVITFLWDTMHLKGTSSAPYATGVSNTAIGTQAIVALTSGDSNIAVGYQAGLPNLIRI